MNDKRSKKAPPEIAEKIEAAINAGNIVMTDSFEIEGYEKELEKFMREVLELELAECFVSDESCLSDFWFCGEHSLEDSQYDGNEWGTWVVHKALITYGITISATDYMLTVCKVMRGQPLKILS